MGYVSVHVPNTRWQRRACLHVQINSTAITCDGDSPAVMGQELEYARAHGIDFWSFCNYPLGCVDPHPPASEPDAVVPQLGVWFCMQS